MPYEENAHRKQFVVGSPSELSSYQWPERFRSIQLSNDLELRYCPDLTVAIAKNGSVLLGDVVEARQTRPSPEAAFDNVSRATLFDISESWTGHWTAIVDGTLSTDFLGLSSIYIPAEHVVQKRGALVLSSSPALLIGFYGLSSVDPLTSLTQTPVPPWCFHPDLRTLLAGEEINVATGRIELTESPALGVYDITSDEVRREVSTFITTGLKRLGEKKGQLLSALTAGYDTRLNTSACHAAGVDYETFTLVKKYLYMTNADRDIPPILAKLLGATHHHVTAGTWSDERAKTYIEHAGGSVSGFMGDGYSHYAGGFWEKLGYGRTCLDGLCYELAVNYHDRRFDVNFGYDDFRAKGFGTTEEAFKHTERHWEHLRQTSFPFDRRDLAFWTANCNGAYARVIQKHDLFADIFVTACNRHQMWMLLSIPVADRDRCMFEATITSQLAPELISIPYNPPEPAHKRALKRLRKEILKRM